MAEPVNSPHDGPAEREPDGAAPGAPAPDVVTPAPGAVEVLPPAADPDPVDRDDRFTLLVNREPSHPKKFFAGAMAVGALAAAALVGLAFSLSSPAHKSVPFAQGAAPGSKAFEEVGPRGGWHPVCDVEFGCDRPHQIAAYVAPKYVLADGKEAMSILSGTPTISNQDGSVSDVGAIIERNDRGSRIIYTDSANDNTVQYNLCGYGTNCTLTGTASIARGDELRRAALELALLTFKYDTSVKSVLVFSPKPQASNGTSYALLFRRADHEAQLQQPLADTLGKQVVVKPADMTEDLAKKIGDITAPRVFTYAYRTTQQGLPVLVLTPAGY